MTNTKIIVSEAEGSTAPRPVLDKFDWLPPHARERYEDLDHAADAAFAEARRLGNLSYDQHNELEREESALRELEKAAATGGLTTTHIERLPDKYTEFGADARELRPIDYPRAEAVTRTVVELDVARLEAQRALVAKLRRRRERTDSARAAASAKAQQLGGLRTRIQEWVAQLRAPAVPYVGKMPKAPAGDRTAAVEQLRQQRLVLLEEIEDVESAPQPSSVTKQRMRREIEDLAAAGAPRLGFLEDREIGPWPRCPVSHSVVTSNGSTGRAIGSMFDALAFIAWFHRDELIARLAALIEQHAEDDCALTDEQKAARIAERRAQILQVERTECEVIWAAHDAGAGILPRADTDVRAFLGLSAELSESKEE